MPEPRSATGSCVRCHRALDLAAVKVDGRWYGRAACAQGDFCPLDQEGPAVKADALINRPNRYYRRRAPKELRRSAR